MKVGARSTTGWRATIAVAMSNYIEAGSIIAIATSLAFWQAEFGISNFAVGLLAALTLAPSLDFIDAGELAAVAHTFGVAHPTGYPLFTLLAGLWARLPIGDGITIILAPSSRASSTTRVAGSPITTWSVAPGSEDEARCHRSLLRALLVARGAHVA